MPVKKSYKCLLTFHDEQELYFTYPQPHSMKISNILLFILLNMYFYLWPSILALPHWMEEQYYNPIPCTRIAKSTCKH